MLIKLRGGHSGFQQLGIEGLAYLSHNLCLFSYSLSDTENTGDKGSVT